MDDYENEDQPELEDEELPADAQPEPMPPSAVNLVAEYQETDGEWLEKEAKKVVKRYKEARESMSEYLEKRAELLALYGGVVQSMKYPADGGKAPHLSLLCRALLQLSSRIWDAVCPTKGDAIQVLPVGTEDEGPAQRRQKHINWQIRHKITDWADGHRANIVMWLLGGSSFRAKSYDPVARITKFDYLTPDEIAIPFTAKDVHPLMPSVHCISRLRTLARHELEAIADTGWYVNVAELYPEDGAAGDASGGSSLADDSAIAQTVEDIEGVSQPDKKAPYGERDIIEQHTWLKLPGEKRSKPVIFTVDAKSSKPLRLTIRQIEDPIDRMRFDAEMRAHQATLKSIEGQNQVALEEWYQGNAGVPPEMAAPEPEPIMPPPEPRAVRMKTIHEIVHYRCFDNPAGFLGIGVGYLLSGNNSLADALASAYLVAAQMHNLSGKTGWLARGAFPGNRGTVELEMGKYTKTEMESEELEKGIKDLQFPPPADGLVKIIQMLMTDSESMVANVAQLSGEQGPTNETKAAAMIRQNNAMALVSVLARLYQSPMGIEVKLLAQDNALFMDPEEVFWVTEPSKQDPEKKQATRNTVRRDDYYGEFDFEWLVDSRLQTKAEKINEVDSLIDRISNSPMVKSPALPALMDLLFRMRFRAMERPELEARLGPPPPPPAPPPPPQPMSQIDENAGFMNEKDHPVLPDDDDMFHLSKMGEFEADPMMGKAMSPTGKQMFDRHRRAHMANLYKKTEAMRAKAGMGAPGGPPGMGAGPNNGSGPGAAPPGVGRAGAPPPQRSPVGVGP